MIDDNEELIGQMSTSGQIIASMIGERGPTGQQGEQGKQGNPGQDGISPTVNINKVGKVTTITITDAEGVHIATINDGQDGSGIGDMLKSVYDTNDNGIVDNAEKVNNHTVNKDVPSDAKFTDTIYDDTPVIAIEAKIPNQASSENQLADKNFVNSSINSITAFYITKNANGDQFDSKTELDSTTTFYSGGEIRIPTRNDYCIVLDDETKNHSTTRYIYQNGQWEYQYTVNETALTAAQLAALNSGITSSKVEEIDIKEDKSNKVTEINSSSTNEQYPSAKSVYDNIEEHGVIISPTEPTDRKKVWLQKGNNLLDLSNFVSQTKNGLTFTYNNDGTFTINGTATEGTSLFIPLNLTLKSGTYTHSIDTLKDGLFFSLNNVAKTMLNPIQLSVPHITFNEQSNTTYTNYTIWVDSGITFNNETFRPIINKGNAALPYEEYIPNKLYVLNNNNEYEEFTDTVHVGMEPNRAKVWLKKSNNLWKFGDIDFTAPTVDWYFPDGQSSAWGSNILDKTQIKMILKAGTYTISSISRTNILTIQVVKTGETVLCRYPENSQFTINEDTMITLRVRQNSANVETKVVGLMINSGSTALPYEQYVDKKIYTLNDNGVYEEFYPNIQNTGWIELNRTYDCSYRKVNNIVELNLMAYNANKFNIGSYSTITLGTLPVNFRPDTERRLQIYANGTYQLRLGIKPDGTVYIYNWGNALTNVEAMNAFTSYCYVGNSDNAPLTIANPNAGGE